MSAIATEYHPATSPCITVFTSDNAPLTKRFTLQNGTIQKETHATLYSGTAQTVAAPTARALSDILDGLQHGQAIASGTLNDGTSARIATRKKRQGAEVARSLDFFAFHDGPGWLLWDYDAKTMPPEVAARVADLGGPLEALFHIWPEAKAGTYLVRPSSSDGISAPGMPPMQSAGLHGFFLVDAVARSADILKALEARAWAAGLAWIALSKSGAMLTRSIVDTAVGSPERLIFEAPPILASPLTRAKRPPVIQDTSQPLTAPHSPLEAAAGAERTARARIAPEAEIQQDAFVESRARLEADKTGKSLSDARQSIRRMMAGAVLTDDHLLQLAGGQWARVGDLLDRPENHRLSMPDPIEGQDYGRDKATLFLKPRDGFPEEPPRLVSHAHGQRTVYRFARYEAGPDRLALPPAAVLEDRRPRALKAALGAATSDTILSVAVAVADARQWRAPLMCAPQGIVDFIVANAPAGSLSTAETSALLERIDWLQGKRKFQAISQTGIREFHRARHRARTVTDLTQVGMADLTGVLIIKAPMGAGKTQLIGKPFIDQAKAKGRSVMAIAHRVTLIGELGQRLGLPDYRKTKAGDIAVAGGIAVCLPSTARADIVAEMLAPECLFIDEVAQVLQFLAEPMCAAGEADNGGVYRRLEQLVRDAKAVIVADADIDARTLQFLERCRPGERFTIVTMEERATDKRALMHGDVGKVLDGISVELAGGDKVWLACESAAKARYYAAHFKEQGHKTLCITAETKAGKEENAFLEAPEVVSRDYDIVVSSPAISSGMSIEHQGAPHFTLGAYIGCGTSTRPHDAKQQLGRVRYLTRFLIGLDYSNLTGGQHVAGIKRGAEGAAEIERLDVPWTDFDTYVAGIKAEAVNAKADFAAGLWWVLEAAGWQLERPDDPEDTSYGRIATDAAKAGKDARALALIGAEPMTSHQSRLMDTMARDEVQGIRYQAQQMRTAYGKLDLTREDVDFWDNGRGRDKIASFEDLIGAEVALPLDTEVLSARSFRITRRNLLPALFSGIDLSAPITAEQAKMILDRVMTRPHVFVAAKIVGPKYRAQFRAKGGGLQPVKRPKQPGQELRDILARCGLDVTRKRERSVPTSSLLNTREDDVGTETERHYTYTITPESWANMVGILERRSSFDIDEAIARAGQRPVADPKASSFDALAMVAAFPDHPPPGLIPVTTRERATERLPAVSLPDARDDAEMAWEGAWRAWEGRERQAGTSP